MSNEIDALFDFASANSWQTNSCMASAAAAAAAVPATAVLPCVICSQIFATPQRPPTTIIKHTDVARCVCGLCGRMWVGQLICTNHLVIKMKSKLYKQCEKGHTKGEGGGKDRKMKQAEKRGRGGAGLLQLLTCKIPSRGEVAVA